MSDSINDTDDTAVRVPLSPAEAMEVLRQNHPVTVRFGVNYYFARRFLDRRANDYSPENVIGTCLTAIPACKFYATIEGRHEYSCYGDTRCRLTAEEAVEMLARFSPVVVRISDHYVNVFDILRPDDNDWSPQHVIGVCSESLLSPEFYLPLEGWNEERDLNRDDLLKIANAPAVRPEEEAPQALSSAEAPEETRETPVLYWPRHQFKLSLVAALSFFAGSLFLVSGERREAQS